MFRFTIRDVLSLTALVAMGAGWYCDRQSLTALRSKQARIQSELMRAHQTEALRARESEAAIRLRHSLPTEANP